MKVELWEQVAEGCLSAALEELEKKTAPVAQTARTVASLVNTAIRIRDFDKDLPIISIPAINPTERR